MASYVQKIADSATRRSFIGGSDARIIMGSDEAALVCRERSIVRGDEGRIMTRPSSRPEARRRLGCQTANELGAGKNTLHMIGLGLSCAPPVRGFPVS